MPSNSLVQTVAIAISSDVFDKIHTVGDIGGIVGMLTSIQFFVPAEFSL